MDFSLWVYWTCSVAGGEYSLSLAPIGQQAKMQNKENTSFLALLRPYFALE